MIIKLIKKVSREPKNLQVIDLITDLFFDTIIIQISYNF